jgi:tetratricopeptide (TPR) repeat protein
MINIKCILIFLILLLFGCQNTSPIFSNLSTPTQSLYLDAAFNNVSYVLESEDEVFRLNDDILAMLRSKTNHKQTAYQKSQIILKHLFQEEAISISYDSNANFTAIETYQSQSANCMSLTILAYSLAVAANLEVKVQAVQVPEYWTYDKNFSVLTGHVNLIIKSQPRLYKRVVWGDKDTIIDFDPYIAQKKFPAKTIGKKTLLAMFYNNRGSQALINQNYSRAYQYFKGATRADSKFSAAWGNLGILYKITGHQSMAEMAYAEAVRIEPDNLTALNNLARLFHKQERTEEALFLEKHVHKIRKKNPYYHALLANDAMFIKQYQVAIKHYRNAIRLDKKQHEFYFGLAVAYYQQNNVLLSYQAMEKALALSSTHKSNQQYTAKLNLYDKSSRPFKSQ